MECEPFDLVLMAPFFIGDEVVGKAPVREQRIDDFSKCDQSTVDDELVEVQSVLGPVKARPNHMPHESHRMVAAGSPMMLYSSFRR